MLEEAVHAEETCKAFAVRVAVEHARFETWSSECGLNDAASEEAEAETLAHDVAAAEPKMRRFETFFKYSGPIVTPVLSEVLVLMTQLTNTEQKYASLIGLSDREQASETAKGDQQSTSVMSDITEPAVEAVSQTFASLEGLLLARDRIPTQVPLLLKEPTQDTTTESGFKVRARLVRKAWKDNSLLEIASRVTKTALTPKRLKWVIVDEAKCDSKIRRLSQLNSFLLECLDRTDKTDLFQMMLLQMNTSKDLMQQMRALLDAIRVPPSSAGGTTLVGRDQTRTDGLGSKDFILQAGSFVIAALEAAGKPTRSAKITTLRTEETVALSSRTPYTMADGEEAWIEWKTYKRKFDGDGMLAIDPLTDDRMERLVTLLQIRTKPKEFCVPPCLGYFVDERRTRIGLVFQAPGEVSAKTPRSLLDLFGELSTASLSLRIHTAKALARWLLHLHSVRWFHKGIRSASVLFFTSHGSYELGNPYITGFEYARTSEDAQSTTKPPVGIDNNDFYVHPDYLGDQRVAGYRQVYDIYSLGIVLIELAYWQPIDTILNRAAIAFGLQTPLKPEAARSLILGSKIDVLDEVRSRLGERFVAAVEACLSGPKSSRDDSVDSSIPCDNNAALLYDFHDGVIEMLEGIVI